MTCLEAIQQRHAVRRYTDKEIAGETLLWLNQTIDACNEKGGLHIQLCQNEPEAFKGMMARYGNFYNVKNYIALVGPKGKNLEEKCGYYGEKIAIKAQQLGLNTCWVAMSYKKNKNAVVVNKNEKLLMVIAVGYGETPGVSHKVKPIEELGKINSTTPEWFYNGVKAAQLAPTALNQQKFYFELQGNTVKATPGKGFYTKTDLGIAKFHFETGADRNGWKWGLN